MLLVLPWISPPRCYLSFEFFAADYFLGADFYLLVEDFYLLVEDFYLLADSYFVAVGFYFLMVTLAALVQLAVRLLVLSQYQWHYTREYYKDMP